MKLRFSIAALALSSVAAWPAMAAEQPKADHSHAGHGPAEMATEAELPLKGKVVNFMDAGGYTYVELTENDKDTIWIAISQMQLLKGVWVRYAKGSQMKNFYSKTLNKTFPDIMFVGKAEIAKDQK